MKSLSEADVQRMFDRLYPMIHRLGRSVVVNRIPSISSVERRCPAYGNTCSCLSIEPCWAEQQRDSHTGRGEDAEVKDA